VSHWHLAFCPFWNQSVKFQKLFIYSKY
jgi:hypothetical protein